MSQDFEVRIDKWLWAARFFKTRQLATESVKVGRVEVNGRPVKPGRAVKAGDRVEMRKDGLHYRFTVTTLSDKRLSASLASGLYDEDPQVREEREEKIRLKREYARSVRFESGRPSKRDRRSMERVKRQAAAFSGDSE